MAYRVPNTDTDTTSITGFDTVTNVPTVHASTNITNAGTMYTATFTAPNTTNACKGVLLYFNGSGVTGSMTVTLQENTVDTAAVKALTMPFTKAGLVYFQFPTPYVFTATTAGYYRFKVVAPTGQAGGSMADSGGTLPAYMAVDDRSGALGATDDLVVVSPNNTGTVTVTILGTGSSFGSGTYTGAGTDNRGLGYGIQVGNGGILKWDTSADSTLNLKGTIKIEDGGERQMGTVASPFPSAYKAKLIFNQNAGHANYGIVTASGTGAKDSMVGSPKPDTTNWKTTYVSGTGTAASPLVVAGSVSWSVNDQILIAASSNNATNYNECEYRYIKTVNSPTSYVLSSTVGGAESALTYTHTNAYILNIERNVIVECTDTTYAWWYQNQCTTLANMNVQWARFNTCGSSVTSNRQGFQLCRGGGGNAVVNFDYNVLFGGQSSPFYMDSNQTAQTYTGNIVAGLTTGGFCYNMAFGNANKTFNDCFAVDHQGDGFLPNTCNTMIFNRCFSIGGSKNSNGGAGFATNATINSQFNNCEAHCIRGYGIRIQGGTFLTTFESCLLGSKGENKNRDVNFSSGFSSTLFNNCLLGSTNEVSGNSGLVKGSVSKFHKLDQIDNKHMFFTRYGSAQSCGAGLLDTNVRTAGSMSLRLSPIDATVGFTWSFKILAKALSAVSVSGFIQKNAAFGTDVCTVDLYLPGSVTPDATMNMPDDTSWNVFNLAANYTGTVDLYATVVITAKSATANAYVYVDDIFNGTNKITAFDVWDEGMPSPIMFEQLGDASAVWAVLQSTQTTSGTMGNRLKSALTVPLFLGLK